MRDAATAASWPTVLGASRLQRDTSASGINGGDVRTLAIWLAVGTVLMVRFLRPPFGEQ